MTNMQRLTDCTILRETAKAWLIEYKNEEYWMAKSLCEWDDDGETLLVPLWVIKKEGIQLKDS